MKLTKLQTRKIARLIAAGRTVTLTHDERPWERRAGVFAKINGGVTVMITQRGRVC